MKEKKKKRILLVDDNESIHKDFLKILDVNSPDTSKNQDEAILFGEKPIKDNYYNAQNYDLDSAYQGQEALELVKKAITDENPYALAFIDMRMPPGWDGIETIKQMWKVDPLIQMVICSAYSDHSWEDITRELGHSDNLLILKKPYETIEINQLAAALTQKWELIRNLQGLVEMRTAELQKLYSLTKTTLESTQEGIIGVSLDEKIEIYNENFLKLWNLSIDELKSQKSTDIFRKLAEQVDDPVLFLKITTNLTMRSKTKNTHDWQLKSGKILELYSHPQYLQGEIIGIVYSFRDITEQRDLEAKLTHQATHDSLTGLANRVLLSDRIQQAITYAKRYNLHVGIIILDLDNFKDINDAYGHNAGDLLLKQQVRKLSSLIRENDTLARVGGDEFIIVLGGQLDMNFFKEFAKKLHETFLTSCHIEGHEIIATASLGISIYPQDGLDAETLIINADAALYHAKVLGRNEFQFYQAEFNKHVLERTELASALRLALSRNEFILQYQPLIDLKTNNLLGVEALIRWVHPTLGLLPPLTFIPIAEESGLIIEIGEWVLRNACKQAKQWQESSAFPSMHIAVNISTRQFCHKDFVAKLTDILKETQLSPDSLELEITENLILANVAETVKKMVQLKELGVHFVIDDFGTGYSSFSYLKNFPFDKVKIDKSFMENIAFNGNNSSIVEAIISMTRTMGIEVLAEGIENQGQVDFLLEHHGDQVQGFYYSVPLNANDCTDLLKKKQKVTEEVE